jgi:hypothetical protein
MFAELNRLTNVIVRADLLVSTNLKAWQDLAREFQVEFVANTPFLLPPELEELGAIAVVPESPSFPHVPALVWDALRAVQAQPYETAYVTGDPDELREAQNARVGTVLLGRLKKTWRDCFPDLVTPTVGDLVKVLNDYKNGRVSGYWGEVASLTPGSHRLRPGLLSIWSFNDFLEGIPGQSSFMFAGRYFPSGDARHAKHPLTQRILRVKGGKDDSVLRGIFTDFLNTWSGLRDLGLITNVPRRIAGSPQPFVDLVRKACEESDRKRPVETSYLEMLRPDVLSCRRSYPPQKEAGRYANRRANVEGVFTATKLGGSPRVLLFDDILTSGSTALECSKQLLMAGASFVTVFAFGLNQQVIIAPEATLECQNPECSGHMKYRVNGTKHTGFWGCSNYPGCKRNLPFDEGLDAWNRKNRRLLIRLRREPDVPF